MPGESPKGEVQDGNVIHAEIPATDVDSYLSIRGTDI